jgi:23S rRNA pseudouridine1911/1915/1917 synthase
MEETEYGMELPEGEELLTLEVTAESEGMRLDAFLSSQTQLTRSASVRLIEQERVKREGASKPLDKKDKVKTGERFWVEIPAPEPAEALPEKIPLTVVYEDRDIIVVNKPKGMVVHPAPGNPGGTLVNALLYHCGGSLSGIGGVIRPGIVHRIDKDTEGLLVVAKNDASHLGLAAQLKGHHIDRIYTAIVLGNLREESGVVDAPIGRHPVDRKKMAVIRNEEYTSREAVTHWKVLARGEGDGNSFTYLRCQLETGRTHQIRVHMASVGHPLLGDPLYGGSNTRFEAKHKALIQGQCLHAGELSFTHPTTGKEMHFTCPLPPEMEKTVRILFGEI